MIKRYLIFRESALVNDDSTDVLQDEDSGIKKQSQLGLAQDEGWYSGQPRNWIVTIQITIRMARAKPWFKPKPNQTKPDSMVLVLV
jgi:hypothetical protein